jgi:hypothetical protein
MRKRLIFLSIGAAVGVLAVVAPLVLAPGEPPAPPPAAAAIDHAEHARTIEVMRPPKRARPVIALLTLNEATEVTDFLVPYGVLQRANVADVTVVAERAAPVPLHPFSRLGRGPALLRIEPQSTLRAFDERYPDGAQTPPRHPCPQCALKPTLPHRRREAVERRFDHLQLFVYLLVVS